MNEPLAYPHPHLPASPERPPAPAKPLALDRTWLAIGLLLAGIGALSPAQLGDTLGFTLESLWHILPFLLFSSALAGYLEAARAERLVSRVFAHRIGLAILAAALFGALSPFCSCGVIPLVAALLVAGVPLAAVMAFWISSPIMSPSMFVVTAAGLGLEFALVKTVAAVGIGILAGAATLALQHRGWLAGALRESVAARPTGCAARAMLGTEGTSWRLWRDPEGLQRMAAKTLSMMAFLGKWLSLAFVLESLMVAYLPGETLARWLGSDAGLAIPLAALVGVPAYLNGFAAVPVVSGLMASGMTPGAALSFMLAGAMTSIPAAIAVYSLVRKPVFGWYLLLALAGAMLAGWLYQLVP